jgi:hypothetical protein
MIPQNLQLSRKIDLPLKRSSRRAEKEGIRASVRTPSTSIVFVFKVIDDGFLTVFDQRPKVIL